MSKKKVTYEWIDEVIDIIQSVHGEYNDHRTRMRVKNEIIAILEKYKIFDSYVDCSSNINTPEVVSHGGFQALVKTKNIDYLFKFITE